MKFVYYFSPGTQDETMGYSIFSNNEILNKSLIKRGKN